ncbi:MAG: PQQ-binding-like beta-propeller repeat protein [Spirochaetia bacterium]
MNQRPFKLSISVVLTAAVLILGSCGSSVKPEVAWPNSEEDIIRGEYGPVTGPEGTLYIAREDGVYAVSRNGEIQMSTKDTGAFQDDIRLYDVNLAVGEDGTVFVSTGNSGGLLAALSPELELRWSFTVSSYLSGADPAMLTPDASGIAINNIAVSDEGTVYLGTEAISNESGYFRHTGFVIAVSSDGSAKWDAMLPFSDVVSGPLIASNGTVIIGVSNPPDHSFGQVIMLDPEDGSELWFAETEPDPAITLGPKGTIYSGGGFGTLSAFTREGENIWDLQLDDDIDISDVTEPVVAGDGTVYWVAGDLYSISPKGELNWKTESDGDNQALIAGEDLIYTYSTMNPDRLTAFNTEGDMRWQFPEAGDEDSPQEGFAFVDSPVFDEESGLIGLIEGFFDNALAHITTGTAGPAPEALWPMPGKNNRKTAASVFVPGDPVPERVPRTPVTREETVIPGGTVRGNLARTGENPGRLTLGAEKIFWDIENKLLSAMAVTGDDDNVYYGGIRRSAGYLAAVDRGTGEEIWRFSAPVAGPVSVTQSAVFFGVYSHSLISLDKSDGSLLWTYPTGGPVITSPAVSEGKVVIMGEDRILRTVDAVTGKLVWETRIPGYIGDSSPALSGESILIQINPRQVAAFDFNTGQEKWTHTFDVDTDDQYWEEKMPVSADGKVFGTSGEYLFALDAATGEELWLNDISGYGYSPLYTEGSLFVISGSWISVVDPDDGTEIGRINTSGGSSKITCGEKIIFVSSSSGVFGFRKADGSRVFANEWDGKRIEPESEVSVIGDRIFLMSRSNRTYDTNHTYSLGTE